MGASTVALESGTPDSGRFVVPWCDGPPSGELLHAAPESSAAQAATGKRNLPENVVMLARALKCRASAVEPPRPR